MSGYLLKRLLLMIPTFLGITIITFAIMKLAPGDPASLKQQEALGKISDVAAIDAVIEETKKIYGLDRPWYEQYGGWVKRIVTFDFGTSYRDHRPVIEKIGESLPITLLLNLITIVAIYVISVPLGAVSALRPHSVIDRASAIILFMLYSLPSFWVAMMLIVFFGGDYFNWFPIIGISSDGAEALPWYRWISNVAWHLVLPVVCLTYGGLAFLTRFVRVSLLEVLRQDFIRTARSKGLPEWKVLMKHAMRNALVPIVTLMGALLPALLGGSVIVEQIFAIPGMGRLAFESVLARDYPVIMAIAAISAMMTLIGMLLSDLLYVAVDPRISFEGKR